MIGAIPRHEIQILRADAMAQAAVAVKTGVSIDSGRRIEREAPVTSCYGD